MATTTLCGRCQWIIRQPHRPTSPGPGPKASARRSQVMMWPCARLSTSLQPRWCTVLHRPQLRWTMVSSRPSPSRMLATRVRRRAPTARSRSLPRACRQASRPVPVPASHHVAQSTRTGSRPSSAATLMLGAAHSATPVALPTARPSCARQPRQTRIRAFRLRLVEASQGHALLRAGRPLLPRPMPGLPLLRSRLQLPTCATAVVG